MPLLSRHRVKRRECRRGCPPPHMPAPPEEIEDVHDDVTVLLSPARAPKSVIHSPSRCSLPCRRRRLVPACAQCYAGVPGSVYAIAHGIARTGRDMSANTGKCIAVSHILPKFGRNGR